MRFCRITLFKYARGCEVGRYLRWRCHENDGLGLWM